MGPAFAVNPATIDQLTHDDEAPTISPLAVTTIDPPAIVLPFSGQTFSMAAGAYLIAKKTLAIS